MTLPVGQVRWQDDVVAVARPVAVRGAGDEALLGELGGVLEQRHVGCFQPHSELRPTRQLECMAQYAEAGNVGNGVHVLVLRELGPDAVQGRRGVDHLLIGLGQQRGLLDRGRVDADADRLGEDQLVARLRIGVAPHLIRPADADHRQAIDRLGAIDRMATSHGNACRGTDGRAAFQDLAHHLDRNLVDRHAEDGERHDRLAAHGIDVGDGVGRGDAAEIVGIVDHRHEEIGGRDDAGVVVDLPHGGIIGGLGAD